MMEVDMQAVKVLPKWQITIPKEIRERLRIKVGDTLVVEDGKEELVLRKGRTILDYVGYLPKLDMEIDEIREKAIAKAAHDRT